MPGQRGTTQYSGDGSDPIVSATPVSLPKSYNQHAFEDLGCSYYRTWCTHVNTQCGTLNLHMSLALALLLLGGYAADSYPPAGEVISALLISGEE